MKITNPGIVRSKKLCACWLKSTAFFTRYGIKSIRTSASKHSRSESQDHGPIQITVSLSSRHESHRSIYYNSHIFHTLFVTYNRQLYLRPCEKLRLPLPQRFPQHPRVPNGEEMDQMKFCLESSKFLRKCQ